MQWYEQNISSVLKMSSTLIRKKVMSQRWVGVSNIDMLLTKNNFHTQCLKVCNNTKLDACLVSRIHFYNSLIQILRFSIFDIILSITRISHQHPNLSWSHSIIGVMTVKSVEFLSTSCPDFALVTIEVDEWNFNAASSFNWG